MDLNWYMVFGAARGQQPGTYVQGHDYPRVLNWGSGPIGVFHAPDAESACQAAARKSGVVGTFFAVEGFPWGVELTDVSDVTELGEHQMLSEREIRLRELERQAGLE